MSASINLFENAVRTIFDSWTGLQIAVANGYGGSSAETKEKYDWFVNATYEWIIENDDLESFELEDFFLDTMNTEFNTILDDNSEVQVAINILGAYGLYKTQQYALLQSETEKLRQITVNAASTRASVKVDVNESSSDEDDDEDDSEKMVEEKTDENNNYEEEKRKAELAQEMEFVEEGWTYVAKSGKHHTK